MSKPPGSKKYTPVWEGLWDHKHAVQMGKAIFLYGELLSRSKGRPTVEVTYQELHEAMGTPIRTLEYWMNRLKKQRPGKEGGYISVEGKNPMIITIDNYRKTKDGKPQDVAVSIPQEIAGQEIHKSQDVAETLQNVAGPNAVTPLTPDASKPSLKDKKKRESLSPKNSSDSKPKAGKKTNPDIKIAIDHYHDEFLRIHGFKPQINGAAAKTFQSLLEGNGGRPLGEIKELITDYLSIPDQKLKDKGFPVTWFPESINGILLKKRQSEELEVSL